MSIEQRETLDSILRQSPLGVGGDVQERRRLFQEMMAAAQPLPPDVSATAAALGSVPTAEITIAGVEPRHVLLYFHGGVYALGSAALAADLASQIGRRIDAAVISVDYRLAPEHPYPAASDRGLPMPAAALLMSPWADLTLTGTSMDTKQGIDPLLSRPRGGRRGARAGRTAPASTALWPAQLIGSRPSTAWCTELPHYADNASSLTWQVTWVTADAETVRWTGARTEER